MPLKKTEDQAPTQRATVTAEERQLLEDARAVGRVPVDEEAMARIEAKFGGRLLAFIEKRCRAKNNAKDLRQETWLRVTTAKATFDHIKQFEGWLFQLARSALDHQQRSDNAKKRIPNPASLDSPLESRASSFRAQVEDGSLRSPLAELLARQSRNKALREIQRMPRRMAQAAYLHFFQHRTQREIATLMRVSEGTVKTHIYQARKRLKAALQTNSDPSRTAERG